MSPERYPAIHEGLHPEIRYLQVLKPVNDREGLLVFWDKTGSSLPGSGNGDPNRNLYATASDGRKIVRRKEGDLVPVFDEYRDTVEGQSTVEVAIGGTPSGDIRRIHLSDGTVLDVKSITDFVEAKRRHRRTSLISAVGVVVASFFWQLSPITGGADNPSTHTTIQQPTSHPAVIPGPKPLPSSGPTFTPETSPSSSISTVTLKPTLSPTPPPETSPTPIPAPSKAPETTPSKQITTVLHVATWNMYYKNKGNVSEAIKTLLGGSDIVLLQEANRHRKSLLKITGNNSNYGLIQERTSQHRNAIVFNKERLILKNSSSFKAAQDGSHERFINTTHFVDKKTGQEVITINIHAPFNVDAGGKPSKNTASVKAYKEYMAELAKWIKKLQKEHPLTIMIVAGDFNVANGPDSKKCSTKFFPCASLGPLLENGFSTTEADEKGATHGKTRDIDVPHVGSPDTNHGDGLATTISNVEIHQSTKKKSGWKGSDHSVVSFTVTGISTILVKK